MNLDAFTDELLRLRPVGLVKQASILRRRPDRILERMTAGGAMAGVGAHTLDSAKAGMTANPYDSPTTTAGGALKKGALGGLLAALGLKTISRIAKKGRR
jgi:hypothetical protein